MVHDDPGAFVLYCTKQKMSLFILGWSKMKLYKSLDKSALKESSLKFLKLEYLGFTDFIVFFSLVKHMGKRSLMERDGTKLSIIVSGFAE